MKILIVLFLCLISLFADVLAQISLEGNSYRQDFSLLNQGQMPQGWSVWTNATATTLGTQREVVLAPVAWENSAGQFQNSADGFSVDYQATAQEQTELQARVLAVRQTANFGDPGAAIALQLMNTQGKSQFRLSFDLHSLDRTSTPRTVRWQVQYALGETPDNFMTVQTLPEQLQTGNNTAGKTQVSVNFGDKLDNKSEMIWIRLIALDSSQGQGARPLTGINNVELTFNVGTSVSEQILQHKLTILPNPAQEQIIVEVPNVESIHTISRISIVNILGTEVMQQTITPSIKKISLFIGTIPNGVYYVFTVVNGNIYSSPLIIQR